MEPATKRVRFLQDVQGVLTQEQFFTAGSEAAFATVIADHLVADGRAELVTAAAKGRTR